jgi:hypothetical protein
MDITREIAEIVRDTVDAGLVKGVGVAEPGKMCVEAAVCYALGLPHGDDPGCVSSALRRLKIRLNDSNWSSDTARAKGLRRLALAQLGSAGVLDDREFARRVVEMTIRKAVPVGLRAAARRNPKHAAALEAAAVRCETEGTREAAREGERVAAAAYAAYAADAAAAAADAAAAYAAYAAADAAAAYAAAAAAAHAAHAAAAAYAYAAYAAAAYAAADYAAADAARADARAKAMKECAALVRETIPFASLGLEDSR